MDIITFKESRKKCTREERGFPMHFLPSEEFCEECGANRIDGKQPRAYLPHPWQEMFNPTSKR